MGMNELEGWEEWEMWEGRIGRRVKIVLSGEGRVVGVGCVYVVRGGVGSLA